MNLVHFSLQLMDNGFEGVENSSVLLNHVKTEGYQCGNGQNEKSHNHYPQYVLLTKSTVFFSVIGHLLFFLMVNSRRVAYETS
jgi:hypothetical protein